MVELTDDEFADAIEAALVRIPDRLLDAMENVQVVVELESDSRREGYTGLGGLSSAAALRRPGGPERIPVRYPGGEILGLYSGIPLTKRGMGYGAGDTQPDTITIYKRPHERCFLTREAALEQVGRTVIHEVAHYFGMDEEQVRAMGY